MRVSARTSFIVLLATLLSTTRFAAAARPLAIVTPAGGEFYVIDSAQRVRLDPKIRARQVDLEISRDGGATFAPLGTIDNTVKDKTRRNVLPFTVTGPASGRCVIRATANGVSTVSSGFSIGSASAALSTTDPITADHISSGDASGGTVLVSDGQGGSTFQTLDGTFVRTAGDDMSGGLNVAGTLGVGTTSPRGTMEVANATQVKVVHAAGGPGMPFVQWVTDTTTHQLQVVNGGGSISSSMTMNFGTGDVRYGSATANSAVTARSNGSVAIDGAFSFEALNRTADFVANDATCAFFCNTVNNNITITLPTAVARAGRVYFVKKTSAANTLFLATTAGETIDGAAGIAMTTNNSVRLVMSNGVNWFVISSQ